MATGLLEHPAAAILLLHIEQHAISIVKESVAGETGVVKLGNFLAGYASRPVRVGRRGEPESERGWSIAAGINSIEVGGPLAGSPDRIHG
jgi:hypothetical protein